MIEKNLADFEKFMKETIILKKDIYIHLLASLYSSGLDKKTIRSIIKEKC